MSQIDHSTEIEPFFRPDEADAASTPAGGFVPALMWLHFVLVSGLLLLAGVALVGNRYAELDSVRLGAGLRLERTLGVYSTELQQSLLLTVGCGLLGLLFGQAAHSLATHRHSGPRWARRAALVLLGGGPLSVVLWRGIDDLPESTSTVAELLSDFTAVLRVGVALVLVQTVLALWYLLRLTSRRFRARLVAGGKAVPSPAQRALHGAGLVWLALPVIGGLTLGVLTDWVYELRVPQPDPGELMYATSFDDLDDEWTRQDGRDSMLFVRTAVVDTLVSERRFPPLHDGVLLVTHGTPVPGEAAWSVLDRVFGDFDLRVTVQQTTGAVDQNQLGVIFRYRDEANFYVFRITSDGYCSLSKIVDGVEEKISDWITFDAIRLSESMGTAGVVYRPNEVRVVAVGDQFRFYVNGAPVPLCLRGENNESMWAGPGECSTAQVTYIYEDAAFQQGAIALAAGTFDGSEIAAAFDDLVIVGPVRDAMTEPLEPDVASDEIDVEPDGDN